MKTRLGRDKLGVLLVTGGRTHQENYAEGFAADPRCTLVGLTDEPDLPALRQQLNRELADTLKVPVLADLDAALNAAGVEHSFHGYDGAGHGFQDFNNPERYREAQTKDALEDLLAFLDSHLK